MKEQFHLVYDIADERIPHPSYVVIALLLLLAGMLRSVYRPRRATTNWLGRGLIAAGLLFGAFTTLMPWWDVWHLKAEMRSEVAKEADGPIADLSMQEGVADPAHKTKDTYEQFTVSGVRFGYWRGYPHAGFHNAAPHAVSLRNGMNVHIVYVLDGLEEQPRIMRLEVENETR